MTDKDLAIINLRDDAAKWRGRALECASFACETCEGLYHEAKKEPECEGCRIKQIREEAAK